MSSFTELEYLSTDEEFAEKYLTQVIASINGADGYGTPYKLNKFDGTADNGAYLSEWAMEVEKQHADGKHLSVAADKLVITDAGMSTNAANVDTDLQVGGDGNVDGSLAVAVDATVGGTLGVTGPTTLLSTLDVTEATTLLSTLDVTEAVTLLSTLAVTDETSLNGDVNLGDAAGDTVTVIGTMTVQQPATFELGAEVSAGQLLLAAGAVGTPSLAIGEVDTGLFRPATDQLAATLGGVERARLTTTGLGIGVTAPVRALHVVVGGRTAQTITTGSNANDGLIIDSGTTGNVFLNLVGIAAGTSGIRFSLPTSVQKANISWNDSTSELSLSTSVVGMRMSATGVGFNSSAPIAPPNLGSAATDPTETMDLVNLIRDALRDLGLAT